MGRNLQSAEKSRLIWEAGRSGTLLSSTAMEKGSLKNNMVRPRHIAYMIKE